MHIALLAGEPSGDQLGAELIKSLRRINPCIRFDGVGGPLMQAEGFNSLLPMADFAVMGISEIVFALPRLLRYKKRLLDNYQSALPDAFIGIDYPEFNLSLEKRLKEIGIYTAHYVSPSVWAWRERRIRHIKAACDLMLTLFPFEKRFYDAHQMPAVYCGHPLTDMISDAPDTQQARKQLDLSTDRHTFLAILPGSRHSEIRKMLPIFIKTALNIQQHLPDLLCLIPAATPELKDDIEKILNNKGNSLNYRIFAGEGKTVMAAADAVLLTSGTATLEAMLLQKPMLVSYKVSPLTGLLAQHLVTTPYFSLPNLLAGHQIVPEFIQDEINTEVMADSLINLLQDTDSRKKMINHFLATRKALRSNGAETAAKAVYNDILHKEISG